MPADAHRVLDAEVAPLPALELTARVEADADGRFDFAAAVALAYAYVGHVTDRGPEVLYKRLNSLGSLISDEGERRRFNWWFPAFVRALATRNLSLMSGVTSARITSAASHPTGPVTEPVSSCSGETGPA